MRGLNTFLTIRFPALRAWTAAFAATLALLLAACGQEAAPRKLTIALVVPLAGELTDVGEITRNAAELAMSAVNATGLACADGVRVLPELLVITTSDTVESAVSAVREAIYRKGAAVVIGGMLSRNAIPMAAAAEEAGTPMISPGSTHPLTTREKRFVFRVLFTDPAQGAILARFARNEIRAARAAVLFDRSDEYSRGLAANFREVFTALHGVLAADESYVRGQEDCAAQARAIAASRPDVLFLPNYHNEVPRQVRQLRDAGLRAALLGGDSWEMLPAADMRELEGSYFTTTWSPDVDTRESRDFIDAYRARFQKDPNPTAAVVYDAFGLLFAAVRSRSAVDQESLRQGLAGLRNYQGVTGTISFPGGGDPETHALILRISGGRPQFHERVIAGPAGARHDATAAVR